MMEKPFSRPAPRSASMSKSQTRRLLEASEALREAVEHFSYCLRNSPVPTHPSSTAPKKDFSSATGLSVDVEVLEGANPDAVIEYEGGLHPLDFVHLEVDQVLGAVDDMIDVVEEKARFIVQELESEPKRLSRSRSRR